MVGLYENSGTQGEVINFMQEKGMSYTIGPANQEVEDAMGGLQGFPTKFLIDRDFKIVLRIGFTADLTYYKGLIAPLLRGPSEVRLVAGWEADGLHLEWPGVANGYMIESTSDPAVGPWTPVQAIGGLTSLNVPVGNANQFYRLKKQ